MLRPVSCFSIGESKYSKMKWIYVRSTKLFSCLANLKNSLHPFWVVKTLLLILIQIIILN